MKLFNWKKFNEGVDESLIRSRLTDSIRSICDEYSIYKYSINEDGSIDVNGSVCLSSKKLTKIPLKFRKVSGYFSCSHNELTSLEGSPKWVGGDFLCHNNQLTTLKGGPEEVKGTLYWCFDNKLTDLEGFPEFWEGRLSISGNPAHEIIKLFPEKKWNKVIYLINEYGAIDGDRVNSYVLEEIFHELGLNPPKIKSIKGYELV